MRSLAFLGLLTTVAMIPAPAQAQADSGASGASAAVALTTQGMRGAHRMRGHNRMRGHYRMRGHHRGNFRRIHRGRTFFRPSTRFFVGGFIPPYFLGSRYYVANYPRYGLYQPGYGQHWARYYNDAYLVDQGGRIADSRYGVGYDGPGAYYDDRQDYRYDDRRGGDAGDTVAGAIAGGVIGGVAGNLIAGEGDRTEGTIIGAAVGAIAGGAIGSAASRSDGRRGGYDYDSGRVPEYVGDGNFYPPAAPSYGRPYLGYHNGSTVQTTVTVNGVTTHASQSVGGMTQSATTVVTGGGHPRTTVVTHPQGHGQYYHHRPAHYRGPHGAPAAAMAHPSRQPHGYVRASGPDQPLPGPAPQLDVPNPPEPTINFIEEEWQ